MRNAAQILATYRESAKRRFLEVLGRTNELPEDIPSDPKAAMMMGMTLGRREGYGTGLVDGTKLGLDVGLGTVDEMLNQPVIFGPAGNA